jgi:hypothetical protein
MTIDEKINEALGISNEKILTKAVVKKEFTPPVPRLEDKEKEDVDNDYKYSRENYYNLIERGQDAIQGILDIANESQHPRAYEVAGNLIKLLIRLTNYKTYKVNLKHLKTYLIKQVRI